LAGSFEGVGAEIGIKKNQLIIIAPIDGAPAQRAGLRAGDMIVKIDGKDASDMTTDEAVALIRGPKGTNVTLTLFRTGWTSTKDFKITRDTIIIPPVKLEFKNEVAYIKISQFDQTLPADFKQIALQIMQRDSTTRIVLDLRGNPGGYLEVAQNIAGYFLPRGQIVTIEDFGKAKSRQLYKSEGGAELLNYPVVVLMDEGSASASEILAGALRDNRGVKLIGTKSFGKGSVQQPIYLRGGSFLKITIAKWLTPKGASISEVGLPADIKVAITDTDIQNKKDPQLDKALEIVRTIK
jgi:carboxyl-terminal processing protease